MKSHWQTYPVPPMRMEAHFGDRVVRCFAERPQSLDAMFRATAAAHGAREALVFEGRRWTYAALETEVAQVAAGLAARGIVQGDRVVLYLGNLPEFIIALYALQRLGAIAVPVNTREQKPGMEYLFNQCGAKGVIYEPVLAERLPDVVACPSVTVRIATGEPFEQLKRHGAVAAAPELAEEDTALILYTSGTTGRPKGAMLTH